MKLFDKLTVEQRSIIKNFEGKATSELVIEILKENEFATEIKVSEAFTIWNILKKGIKFDFTDYVELFELKAMFTEEILTSIARRKIFKGFSEDGFEEIQTPNYWVDLSYSIKVTEDGGEAEIEMMTVYDKLGEEVNIDHISDKEIVKQIII